MKRFDLFDSRLKWRTNRPVQGGPRGVMVLLVALGLVIGGGADLWERAANGDDRVAATVDDVPLYVSEVEWIIERAVRGVEIDVPTQDRLNAEGLDRLVRQQIALTELDRRGEACTQQQLELAVSRLSEELKRQGKSLDDFCLARRIPRSALERAMRWQLTWEAHLTETLTDESLQRYFEAHRSEFDGTRLRVAQILLTIPTGDLNDSRARQQAEDIRGRIAAGSLSFAAAARKYSQAPSGAMGGDMGWISRPEPMPEAFSRAAFQLQQGELSPPITSSLGIHLIQCLEIEPGTRTWQDVRDELTSVVRSDIFDRLVDAAAGKSRIQFSGAVPHFRPGTKELELVAPSEVGSQKSVEK